MPRPTRLLFTLSSCSQLSHAISFQSQNGIADLVGDHGDLEGPGVLAANPTGRTRRLSTVDRGWCFVVGQTRTLGEGGTSEVFEVTGGDTTDAYFRELIANSRHQIIRRVCDVCVDTHKDIFYRRITSIPTNMDFLNVFKDRWADIDPFKNEFKKDFNLYSTYEDAKYDTNRWLYCNFSNDNSDTMGFPRDCGPSVKAEGQWNSYTGEYEFQAANDHAFYVEGGCTVDFPEWKIDGYHLVDGVGVGASNSMKFFHGHGDNTTATRVSIYGLPGTKNRTSTDITDACYSKGGDHIGTLDDIDAIIGMDITEYHHNVADYKTSFNFTFEADIKDNHGLYYETEDSQDDATKLATIRFCVMLELLSVNNTEGATPTDVVVVSYAEYAFGYNATLVGTILLEKAVEVKPADPTTGGIDDETFTVVAWVCGPDDFLQGDGTISQGESMHICVNSTSYPKASISGIDSLTYTAPFGGGGSVVLDAITGGKSVDLLTRFLAGNDCDGSQCIVKTQLQGNFFPPDGFMNVSISGRATMELGGRRVLAEVVPGDRSLQEGTSQSSFSMNVETAASDTSGTTMKGVAISIFMTTVTAASLRFF